MRCLRALSLVPCVGVSLWVLLALAGCRFEVEEDAASGDDLSLYAEEMLRASALAWNQGDLEAFLDGYVDAPTTTYIGEDGLSTGLAEIRQRYASLFEAGAKRDNLRFEMVLARRLGAFHGLVTARWALMRDGTVIGSGLITLVVGRVAGGWKTVHSHASADSSPPDLTPARGESPPDG